MLNEILNKISKDNLLENSFIKQLINGGYWDWEKITKKEALSTIYENIKNIIFALNESPLKNNTLDYELILNLIINKKNILIDIYSDDVHTIIEAFNESPLKNNYDKYKNCLEKILNISIDSNPFEFLSHLNDSPLQNNFETYENILNIAVENEFLTEWFLISDLNKSPLKNNFELYNNALNIIYENIIKNQHVNKKFDKIDKITSIIEDLNNVIEDKDHYYNLIVNLSNKNNEKLDEIKNFTRSNEFQVNKNLHMLNNYLF